MSKKKNKISPTQRYDCFMEWLSWFNRNRKFKTNIKRRTNDEKRCGTFSRAAT
jgi:hypothetical protein